MSAISIIWNKTSTVIMNFKERIMELLMQEVKNYLKVKKDSLKRSLSIKGGVLIEIKVICSPLSKPIVFNSDIRLENIGTVYLTRYP